MIDRIMAAPVVPDLYRLAVEAAAPGGLFLEFGVASGRSMRRLRSMIPEETVIYGFDSFRGLPTRWRSMPAGTFATSYRVALPNVVLVEGMFEHTVQEFAARHRSERVSLMHVDCDLYSSTRDVLSGLGPLIVPGTVMILDELFGYDGWEMEEYRAVVESGLRLEVLGRWDVFRAVVRVVT